MKYEYLLDQLIKSFGRVSRLVIKYSELFEFVENKYLRLTLSKSIEGC